MTQSWKISRRTWLHGVGAAVSLPLLDVMEGEAASLSRSGPDSARRVAYLYIPNGVAEGAWQPEELGQQRKLERLNRWMKPLDPFKDELTVFRNLWTPRGNGHVAGTATWLTGGGFDGQRLTAGGASVDQIAAKFFKGKTLLPSLELSVRGEGIFARSLPRNTLSWADTSTPVPRDIEPRVVFDRMFRGGESGLGDRSVVDLVMEHSRSLKRRVSLADQSRIDEYLESVRAIERRLDFADAQQQRAAKAPGLLEALKRPEVGIPEDHETYLQLMMDMVVLAFWSDATRVCTFMMDHGQSNRYFNFIDGVKGTWHALSHWKDISGRTEDDDGMTSWSSRDEKRDMYNRVTRWHTEQVGYLLGKLKNIEEPQGNLLDSSMIVYGSSLSDGHEHSARNLPLLLAGGGACEVNQGMLRGTTRDTSMSELNLSILQRLGLPLEQFAETDRPMDLM